MIRSIDEINQVKQCSIVAVTAHVSIEVNAKAKLVGIREVLNKPVQRVLLFATIRDAFFK